MINTNRKRANGGNKNNHLSEKFDFFFILRVDMCFRVICFSLIQQSALTWPLLDAFVRLDSFSVSFNSLNLHLFGRLEFFAILLKVFIFLSWWQYQCTTITKICHTMQVYENNKTEYTTYKIKWQVTVQYPYIHTYTHPIIHTPVCGKTWTTTLPCY